MQQRPSPYTPSFADNPTPPAGNAQYTCPMHPEVVQGQRGKCPKCGMKLAPKKGSRVLECSGSCCCQAARRQPTAGV